MTVQAWIESLMKFDRALEVFVRVENFDTGQQMMARKPALGIDMGCDGEEYLSICLADEDEGIEELEASKADAERLAVLMQEAKPEPAVYNGEQHTFEPVGGEFPNTCRKCACFRDSANHLPEPPVECACRKALENLRRYVAVEGRPDGDGLRIGLAYDGHIWGPVIDPTFEPFEGLETVEKWLHGKIDEGLAIPCVGETLRGHVCRNPAGHGDPSTCQDDPCACQQLWDEGDRLRADLAAMTERAEKAEAGRLDLSEQVKYQQTRALRAEHELRETGGIAACMRLNAKLTADLAAAKQDLADTQQDVDLLDAYYVAAEAYCLRLRQPAYAGDLDVRRRAHQEIDSLDLAGKVEQARSTIVAKHGGNG